MKITAIAPWYGGNRTLAATVGRQLGKLDWCGVPFCGGCPELPHVQTRAGIANDLHRHLINLARVVRNETLCERLRERLAGMLFHPDELKDAHLRCAQAEKVARFMPEDGAPQPPDVEWACAYFVSCWMGRGGAAGKNGEFNQSLSLRWTSSGGSSAKRFQSAVESLKAWHTALAPWEFSRLDALEFLDKCKDQRGHGIYVDAPWPDAGDEYQNKFPERSQRLLAGLLQTFDETRVVVRYGDHPLIRELYPATRWNWIEQASRNQANQEVNEVLIVNGKAL